MAEEEGAHEDPEHTTEEVKQDHGFRPACRAEGLPGIVPPVSTLCTQIIAEAAPEIHEGKHAEAQKAPHPIEEEKAKIDKSKRTVSSFAPSRGALYSFGSGVLLVALLMLGLWVLQVRQHHAVEELLMKQDKAHIREVRQLNQRLEEMSDQKTVFQRRARDLQARAVESETLAAKLQMRTEELETQSQQQAVDSSTREKALRDLRGELKSAREEENATVAHFVEQLSRDTGTLAEAVEQDRENLEKSKAVLTLQARALTSQSKQVANGKREIRQLRHELEESNSKQKRLRQESSSQQKALKEQLVKASLMQKTIVDSSASWKHKLQELENQKEALRRDLDGQRETLRIFSTTAKEKLESAELEAKKHAAQAVGKLEAQLAQQENLVQSLLQQLQHRTAERDAGKRAAGSLAARVVTLLDRPGEVPIITICCDMSGELFAMSFYNTEFQKLQQAIVPCKTVLAVENASLRQIEVTIRGQLKYSCVAVGNPAEVWIIGASAGVASASLACAAGGSVVYSVAADRSMEEAKSSSREVCGQSVEECEEILSRAAADGGRAAVLRALVPQIRCLVGKELGTDAGSRLQRVEAMLHRIGRGEVFRSEEKEGQRRSSGYVAGLEPCSAFHDPTTLTWAVDLQGHWKEIQSELQSRLDDDTVWFPSVSADDKTENVPEWRIAAVLAADCWEDKGSFPKTQEILKRLEGLLPFEVFFAQLPPRTKIAPHSDNLNYILTLHLALQLEPGGCSLQVGHRTRQWEEGEVLVFDATFSNSAINESDQSLYALVVRFWHPGLCGEERKALQLSHLLLSHVLAADADSDQAELPWM